LVGNGFTHPTIQYASYIPTVCTNISGYGPFVNTSTCHQMLLDLPKCQDLANACAANVSDTATCVKASKFCEKTQADPFYATGRNAYDMAKFGDYEQEKEVHDFLNRVDVRHQLGVDREPGGGVREFIGCSDAVGEAFAQTGDGCLRSPAGPCAS
jgi:cathepsin A (carboxypeptidase C)